MNIDKMKTWIKALRSGDYEPTIGALRTDSMRDREIISKFCCLGVLCDTVKGGNGEWVFDGFQYDGICRRSFLPENLAEELGLTEAGAVKQEWADWNYWHLGGRVWHTLSLANDHYVPFSDIADELERYMNEYARRNDIQL